MVGTPVMKHIHLLLYQMIQSIYRMYNMELVGLPNFKYERVFNIDEIWIFICWNSQQN